MALTMPLVSCLESLKLHQLTRSSHLQSLQTNMHVPPMGESIVSRHANELLCACDNFSIFDTGRQNIKSLLPFTFLYYLWSPLHSDSSRYASMCSYKNRNECRVDHTPRPNYGHLLLASCRTVKHFTAVELEPLNGIIFSYFFLLML